MASPSWVGRCPPSLWARPDRSHGHRRHSHGSWTDPGQSRALGLVHLIGCCQTRSGAARHRSSGCSSDVPRHSPVFCCPTQGVCQTACGGESQALRRECTVAGGDCRAAGEAQGCRPERSLPVWQRQKVQEVLPPLKGSPAAPTRPAVRKALHKLAQSAASQILLATHTVLAGVVTARGRREDRTMADETFRWFAGVDWGSAKHQVCLLDEAGKVVGERAFAHGGAGLAALCDWLVSAAGDPGSVAVAIEVPHGPVVDALLDRGFAVHAINPKQLERLRDRVSLAGAKDDRRDARVAAGGLRTDPHLFRPVEASDPAVIALREWSRLAEELQQERMRLSNRIRQQLWRYYPQLLAVSDDVTAEWVLALWSMAPTPAKAARLREATLARLLQEHRIRRVDAERVLGLLRQPAITVANGVTEAAVLHLRSLVARLRLANREFHQAGRKLNELCATLSKSAAAVCDAPPDA